MFSVRWLPDKEIHLMIFVFVVLQFSPLCYVSYRFFIGNQIVIVLGAVTDKENNPGWRDEKNQIKQTKTERVDRVFIAKQPQEALLNI